MLYLAQDFWQSVIDENELIPAMAIILGCTVGVIAIVAGALRSILVNRAREMTKRELAAYVAEGSLDPDKAVAMINAGESSGDARS